MFYRLAAIAILLICGGAADAHGTFRCEGQIIDAGTTKAEVLGLCGRPSARIVDKVPVRAGNVGGFSRLIGYTADEQWVYDRGYGKFPAVLNFFNGRIQRIDYLPYRSGDG